MGIGEQGTVLEQAGEAAGQLPFEAVVVVRPHLIDGNEHEQGGFRSRDLSGWRWDWFRNAGGLGAGNQAERDQWQDGGPENLGIGHARIIGCVAKKGNQGHPSRRLD